MNKVDFPCPEANRSNRIYGLDLLRIVSMLMITVLHTLGHGGVLKATETGSWQYTIAWAIEIFAYCAVNCYALISGYVGIKAKYKYCNIASLWLQAVLYSLLATLAVSIINKSTVSYVDILNSFLPVSNQTYWYFTAYFCIFFFMPAMNFMVNNMPKRELCTTVLAIMILFSVISTFSKITVLKVSINDVFATASGYSPLWLALLYIIGAYISKYRDDFKLSPALSLAIYLAAAAVTLAEKLIWGTKLLINYTSPTVLLCAIALLICFSGMKCTRSRRVIAFLAPLSFGVYLIHDHPLIRGLIYERFAYLAQFPAWKMGLTILGIALSIYLLCSAIDFVRHTLFKLLGVKNLLARAEETVSKKISQRFNK